MDMTVAVVVRDRFDATSPIGPTSPCPAQAKADTVATSISWISARSEYWPVHRAEASPGLIVPGPVLGVACLVFGRTAVVVTVDGGSTPALLVLVRAVRDLGAFVVRAGMAAGGNHLHHFPLRAATIPRVGRLICVDLADHLACWPPGGVADLHVIPSAYDAAEQVFPRLADAVRAENPGGAQAINLHLQLNADAHGSALVEIDRLATSCQGFLLAPDGNMVFTNTERLDGTATTADLLIVQ